MVAVALVANAQEKKYPEQMPMKPQMSEYWTPQPKIVTPGDQKSAGAPSDAIILFDGKDLSAWEQTNGEPAGWKVKNGVMTVEGRHPHEAGVRQLSAPPGVDGSEEYHRRESVARQQRRVHAG